MSPPRQWFDWWGWLLLEDTHSGRRAGAFGAHDCRCRLEREREREEGGGLEGDRVGERGDRVDEG